MRSQRRLIIFHPAFPPTNSRRHRYVGFRLGLVRPDDALAVAFAAQLEDGEFHGYALNLSGGTVSDHGAEALANALREKNPVVKLDLGDKKAKRKPKRLAVGEEEAAEVGAGALMIHVEKCLSRLRKSLSPATLANTQYAVALDWLSKQLKDGTLPPP